MSLPSLKIALPVIFGIWCIAGAAMHGTVMLAYPAMWAGVGLLFAGLHFALKPNADVQEDDSGAPATSSQALSRDSSPSDQHVSATV